ncbi:MAG TPA: hypothetical protein VGR21_11880 [Cryptosporangiaceae bacterium]|nr:hypothetical protein [Cryptosporangiaceae bacterium]
MDPTEGHRAEAVPISGEATVRFRDAAHTLTPGSTLTFGRADTCTVVLDPEDTAISRLAGVIEYESGTWWVVNRSSARSLAVVDELGLRSVLPPGRRWPVEAPVRVVVDGSNASHTLSVSVAAAEPGEVEPPEGVPTSVGEGVLVSNADRLALVALFAGYLEEGSRYDPYPRSYAAAAARLGWPRTTLVKRVEYLRTRLTQAGVPNLMGWNALVNLAEYALTTGLIGKKDLQLIGR